MEGFGAAGGLVDVAEDEFAFAAGVSRADDAVDAGGVQDLADGIELVAGLVADDEGPVGGEHGEGIATPGLPLGADFMRLAESRQMADGPGDHVAVAVEIAFATRACAEDLSNVAGDGRFFGQHGHASGFAFGFAQ